MEHDIPRMLIGRQYWADLTAPMRRDARWAEFQESVCAAAGEVSGAPPDATSAHRPKIPDRSGEHCPANINACVARPVTKAERRNNKDANDSVQVEWQKLSVLPLTPDNPGGGAWDETRPRPLREVLAEAKARGEEAHWGYIFDSCVEKNSELEISNKLCKFQGRVVFAGNRVKN